MVKRVAVVDTHHSLFGKLGYRMPSGRRIERGAFNENWGLILC
ncbi:hypothetical protein [Undibacterium sp.]